MLSSRNPRIRKLYGALTTVNWLALKLWLSNRRGARMFPATIFRNYLSLGGNGPWKARSVLDVFRELEGCRITLQHIRGTGVHAPIEELADLALITHALKPREIFEIGTYRGRTALNFALNSPDECIIHTLDLPPERRDDFRVATNRSDSVLITNSETGIEYKGTEVEKKIEQLFGNSLEFDFGPYYERMDLVFVDGAHHYEAARSDSENAVKMVRPGGAVVWHDFANYGDYYDVTRAVLDCVGASSVVQIDNTQLAVYRKPLADGS